MQPGTSDHHTVFPLSRSALRRVGVPVLAVVVAIPYYLPRISLATSPTTLRRTVSSQSAGADAPPLHAVRLPVETQSGESSGLSRLSHRAAETCRTRPAQHIRIMHIGGLHGP